jgi:DNA-directed RNA polymerase specialized sigma24 family protein
MVTHDNSLERPQARRGDFATTHWSIVASAGGSHSEEARRALATLCENYWFPLYAYVRRRGYEMHEAEDLTQEFFLRLMAKNYLADVDRWKGKFRAFLLASLKHFLANEWDRQQTRKRGGGQTVVSLDRPNAENRYRRLLRDEIAQTVATPEGIDDETHYLLYCL